MCSTILLERGALRGAKHSDAQMTNSMSHSQKSCESGLLLETSDIVFRI